MQTELPLSSLVVAAAENLVPDLREKHDFWTGVSKPGAGPRLRCFPTHNVPPALRQSFYCRRICIVSKSKVTA
jgi:hypothetical protein